MRINVTRSSMPSFDEYCEEIKCLWDSRWLTNAGAKHEELRKELRDYLKVHEIELTVNGHMALEIALQAMGLNGGEVITIPFSFASTTHAIVRSGLRPVFCDINEKDYTIDTSKIEKLITPDTVAILPVHVYGNICDIDEIKRIGNKHGLKVIYDAAHAFGEMLGEKGIASFGDVSCFSFHATKVYHTIEGGAVVSGDDAFMSKVKRIRDFGIADDVTVDYVGTNAKMNEFAAAMGLCNLRHIDEEIDKRKEIDSLYRKRLEDVNGIRLCCQYPQDLRRNYAYFPIVIDEKKFKRSRDDVYDDLNKSDIHPRKYFYPLISDFSCYSDMYDSDDTPVAEYISSHVIALPIYADLDLDTAERICDIILREGNYR